MPCVNCNCDKCLKYIEKKKNKKYNDKGEKKCCKCNIFKPLNKFHSNGNGKKRGECSECRIISNKKAYQKLKAKKQQEKEQKKEEKDKINHGLLWREYWENINKEFGYSLYLNEYLFNDGMECLEKDKEYKKWRKDFLKILDKKNLNIDDFEDYLKFKRYDNFNYYEHYGKFY